LDCWCLPGIARRSRTQCLLWRKTLKN